MIFDRIAAQTLIRPAVAGHLLPQAGEGIAPPLPLAGEGWGEGKRSDQKSSSASKTRNVALSAGQAWRRNRVPHRARAVCSPPCGIHAVRRRTGSIQLELAGSSERRPSVPSGWAERPCHLRLERRSLAQRGDRRD